MKFYKKIIVSFCILLIFILICGGCRYKTSQELVQTKFSLTLPPATTAKNSQNVKKEIDYSQIAKENYAKDIEIVAKLLWCEARGIQSKIEKACVVWTVLNRVDSPKWQDSVSQVVLAPHQFSYRASAKTIDDSGLKLIDFVAEIFGYWLEEKDLGYTKGRVLPNNYFFFYGDGEHNYFRKEYKSTEKWDYSLNNPYKD